MNKEQGCIYARKSQESIDRQIRSIPDQLNSMRERAELEGAEIVVEYSEALPGGKPGIRDGFNEMIDRINKGEIQTIFAWDLTRLARNPVESGMIQYLLQRSMILRVVTERRVYYPEDSALLMSVENGMGNQFLLDLSKNVKRGMGGKMKEGWFPAKAPYGYLNDKDKKTIVQDPVRFPIIKKMWEFMVSGGYRPQQVLDMANKEWGLSTYKGKPMHISTFHCILTSPFYTGNFLWDGKLYKGNHEAMVTSEQFELVRERLCKKGKSRPSKREFPLTGLISCAECGHMITAEKKTKWLASRHKYESYTYYHCTRKSSKVRCKQPAIRSEVLEEQIQKILSSVTLAEEFRSWAIEVLGREATKRSSLQREVAEGQNRRLSALQRERETALDLCCQGLITSEEFERKRNALQEQIADLEMAVEKSKQLAEEWVDIAIEIINFAGHALTSYNTGDIPTKKKILLGLGQNYSLRDGILSVQLHPWFIPLLQVPEDMSLLDHRLEPMEDSLNRELVIDPEEKSLVWQAYPDSN